MRTASEGDTQGIAGCGCQAPWRASITLFVFVLNIASALRCGGCKLASETMQLYSCCCLSSQGPVNVESSVWSPVFVELNPPLGSKCGCPLNYPMEGTYWNSNYFFGFLRSRPHGKNSSVSQLFGRWPWESPGRECRRETSKGRQARKKSACVIRLVSTVGTETWPSWGALGARESHSPPRELWSLGIYPPVAFSHGLRIASRGY